MVSQARGIVQLLVESDEPQRVGVGRVERVRREHDGGVCAGRAAACRPGSPGYPATGTGTTTINFTVAANTGPARNANIVIGGQTFTVSQANGCTYSAAPGSLTFAASGTPAQDITITAGAGCTWTAVPDQPWIHIVSGGSGTGGGTISVDLLANMDGSRAAG